MAEPASVSRCQGATGDPAPTGAEMVSARVSVLAARRRCSGRGVVCHPPRGDSRDLRSGHGSWLGRRLVLRRLRAAIAGKHAAVFVVIVPSRTTRVDRASVPRQPGSPAARCQLHPEGRVFCGHGGLLAWRAAPDLWIAYRRIRQRPRLALFLCRSLAGRERRRRRREYLLSDSRLCCEPCRAWRGLRHAERLHRGCRLRCRSLCALRVGPCPTAAWPATPC